MCKYYMCCDIGFLILGGVNAICWLSCSVRMRLLSPKVRHNAERRGKNKSFRLSCLEVMPFCGFNTRPKHCALVSPAISSNLATLNWILCKGPSVLWERHTLFSGQRAYSGAVVFWIAPGLTSQTGTVGVTFHFLLAMGKRSIPQGGGLAPLAPLLHRQHSSTSANVVDSSYRDLTVGVMHTHGAIKPLRPTFIITVKRSVWPLTFL